MVPSNIIYTKLPLGEGGGGGGFMLYSYSFHVREKCFNLMIMLVTNESHHQKSSQNREK